jgi:Protein of unknown function (DUF3147)
MRVTGGAPPLFTELLLRFVVGGIIVSTFAFLSDLFKPKSFAGLFGAAPSVALATLGITVAQHGTRYASSEARTMIAGAVALFAYAACLSWVMMRRKWPALAAASGLAPVWLAVALGLWCAFFR